MQEVLVNRLGGLSLPRKSVVRLTYRPDMTLDVYRGRKTTIPQQQQHKDRKTAISNSQNIRMLQTHVNNDIYNKSCLHIKTSSSVQTQNVGILISKYMYCQKHIANIVNKAVKDTRLE